jgi:hypothetical protein
MDINTKPALELPPDPQTVAMNLTPDAPQEPATPPAPTPDPPAAAPPVVQTQEDPAVSRAFSKIAEKERELRQRERELKDLEARLKPNQELAELVEKKDKWSLLDRMGVTYDELTREYVQGKGADPQAQMKTEIERVRQQMEAQVQELKAAEQRRYFEEERRNIQAFVQSSNAYPHLQAAEAHELVQQTIQSHFRETGDLVSYEDAAEAVEQQLGQLVGQFLQNPSVRQKYAGLFTVASPPKSPSESAPSAPRTLRNEDTQDRVTLVEHDFDTLSEDEQIARLARQLRFIS